MKQIIFNKSKNKQAYLMEPNSGFKIVLSDIFRKSGFLFLSLKEAERLGLTGSAKFLTDDTVELLLYGRPMVFEDFLKWCQKEALSLHAKVKEVSKIPFKECLSFEIL